MHTSVVIAFDSEAAAQKTLKNKLYITDILVRTAIFEKNKAALQCLKCQKFSHIANSCKNLAICQFCAQNHSTRLHTCKTCEIVDEICIHTSLKCSNCTGKHAANSKECNIVITALTTKKQNSNSNSTILNKDSTSIKTEEL